MPRFIVRVYPDGGGKICTACLVDILPKEPRVQVDRDRAELGGQSCAYYHLGCEPDGQLVADAVEVYYYNRDRRLARYA